MRLHDINNPPQDDGPKAGSGWDAPRVHVTEPDEEHRARQRALFHRGSTVLDASPVPEPVWGHGSEVAASKGEPMLVTGGVGAGKTTLLGNLTHARLGLSREVLGLPMAEGGRVLYLACDRPRQIMRNLRRLFTEADRPVLDERLIVWKGPLPRDLGTCPEVLREMCAAHDLGEGDTVVVDGIKDVARDLVKDETGSAVNAAFQLCVRDGIEVWGNHHQRKSPGGKDAHKPKGLDDVYGSRWITAGAGTVLLLWADRAGQAYVDLSTLKPAADDIGPLRVHHDLDTGRMVVADAVTLESFLIANRHTACNITQTLVALGKDPKDDNERDRIRRALGKMVKAGAVQKVQHDRPEGGLPENFYQWIGPS
jgi:replicative DNA helicase